MQTDIWCDGQQIAINELQLFGGGPYDIESVVLVRRRQLDGSSKWAIVRNQSWCLNKESEWELEPIPSSRDAAFLERCRYDDPRIAVRHWMLIQVRQHTLSAADPMWPVAQD